MLGPPFPTVVPHLLKFPLLIPSTHHPTPNPPPCLEDSSKHQDPFCIPISNTHRSVTISHPTTPISSLPQSPNCTVPQYSSWQPKIVHSHYFFPSWYTRILYHHTLSSASPDSGFAFCVEKIIRWIRRIRIIYRVVDTDNLLSILIRNQYFTQLTANSEM